LELYGSPPHPKSLRTADTETWALSILANEKSLYIDDFNRGTEETSNAPKKKHEKKSKRQVETLVKTRIEKYRLIMEERQSKCREIF
jgi:mRNA-degrading endonuclease RelE of RelBE toxin-antitoxin system